VDKAQNEKLIVFDLDGTLEPSKAAIDAEMATPFAELLGVVRVAIISGGGWDQFETQVLAELPHDANLGDLSILPTSGTTFYQHTDAWQKLYSEDLSDAQKQQIVAALKAAVDSAGFSAAKTWGPTIDATASHCARGGLDRGGLGLRT